MAELTKEQKTELNEVFETFLNMIDDDNWLEAEMYLDSKYKNPSPEVTASLVMSAVNLGKFHLHFSADIGWYTTYLGTS